MFAFAGDGWHQSAGRKGPMLLWRLASTASGIERVECHLIRRDMEYRLSLRLGKAVVFQETHRTPTKAAQRAEQLRRSAIAGTLPLVEAEVVGNGDRSVDNEQAG